MPYHPKLSVYRCFFNLFPHVRSLATHLSQFKVAHHDNINVFCEYCPVSASHFFCCCCCAYGWVAGLGGCNVPSHRLMVEQKINADKQYVLNGGKKVLQAIQVSSKQYYTLSFIVPTHSSAKYVYTISNSLLSIILTSNK